MYYAVPIYHVPSNGRFLLEKPTAILISPVLGMTQFCLFTSQ